MRACSSEKGKKAKNVNGVKLRSRSNVGRRLAVFVSPAAFPTFFSEKQRQLFQIGSCLSASAFILLPEQVEANGANAFLKFHRRS